MSSQRRQVQQPWNRTGPRAQAIQACGMQSTTLKVICTIKIGRIDGICRSAAADRAWVWVAIRDGISRMVVPLVPRRWLGHRP